MPPYVDRSARVTRALELLAPPGAVRTLLSVGLTERSTEEQESLRDALGDPAAGMDPGEIGLSCRMCGCADLRLDVKHAVLCDP
ncbi:hypothetical protein ACFXAF_33715 [Kitasatospora sp. NPDC059463]|uniref:hypothetical protein n=1 Tax=unclassified Kitasatospora TaxID=2633591 RepID=UPI00367DF758